MQVEAGILAALILGFAVVILFCLAVLIGQWVKVKSKAYIWFLIQVVLLVAAFYKFVKLLLMNLGTSRVMISEENSLALGIIGVLWGCSMLCMLIGIYMLGKGNFRNEQPDGEKEEYSPDILKVLGMLAFYVFLCPTIPYIIAVIASKRMGFSQDDPLVYFVTTIAGLGLLILWLKRKYIINLKTMFSMEKVSALYFLPMTLTILGSAILLSEVGNFTTRLIPVNEVWLKIFSNMLGEGFATWKGILAVVVAAPIVEEIILRGLVLRGLLKHYSVRKSIIISAILFGVIHMNPWQFVSAFAAGIILGWWYVKTDSIIPTIFGHALNNSVAFIAGAIGLKIPGFNTDFETLMHQPIWFDLLGVVLLAGGIVWLVKLFKERQIAAERTLINAEEGNLQ